MTYQELAAQARQLPLRLRLDVFHVLTLSLKDELDSPRHAPSTLECIRGIAKPDGAPPTDQERKADYADYLAETYS